MGTIDVTAIILAIISFLSGLGWMLDRKKHRQEIESLKADNRMKDMELGKAYVDEFRSNIARPLQEEVKDLRMECIPSWFPFTATAATFAPATSFLNRLS